MKKQIRRIGIYSGTFDPVHAGHIAFALQALETGKLDAVYFLPERRPRGKQGVEHFGHRVAMLTRATRPHTKLKVLELEELSFTVDRTMPKLQKRFPETQLVLLLGSDAARRLPLWGGAELLLKKVELIVGVREQDDVRLLSQHIRDWPIKARAVTVLQSYAADVSSRQIREALQKRQYVKGLLASVARYSDRHWLYVSLA